MRTFKKFAETIGMLAILAIVGIAFVVYLDIVGVVLLVGSIIWAIANAFVVRQHRTVAR